MKNQIINPDVIRKKLSRHRPLRLHDPERISAAVLIPFFEKDGELYLLFTKRTIHVQHHRGEICFPGGSMHPEDPDLQTTALRELEEELAISPDSVEVIGILDEMSTVASNFLVVPYVGMLRPGFQPVRNESEVEEILEVPVRHLLDPAIFSEDIRVVDQKEYTVYYYHWRNHTIWGVTGRILKSLLDLIAEGVNS